MSLLALVLTVTLWYPGHKDVHRYVGVERFNALTQVCHQLALQRSKQLAYKLDHDPKLKFVRREVRYGCEEAPSEPV